MAVAFEDFTSQHKHLLTCLMDMCRVIESVQEGVMDDSQISNK